MIKCCIMKKLVFKRKLLATTLVALMFAVAFAIVGCHQDKPQEKTEIKSVKDLAGRPVAVLTGSLHDFFLQDNKVDEKVLRLNSPAEVLAALEAGNAQYAIVDEVQILNVDLKKKGLEIALRFPELGGNAAVAFSKDASELCAQFNAFLKDLKESGTLDAIVDKWSSKCLDTVKPAVIPLPENGKPLVVGTMASDVPLSMIVNNQWAGIEIEMMQLFGAYLGRPVQFQNYDFAALIPAVTSKRVDLAVSFIFITEERAQQVLFSDAYFFCESICLGKSGEADVSKNSFWQKVSDGFQKNLVQEDRWKLLVDGLWVTVVISFFSLLLGTILGAGLCFLRMNKHAFWRGFAKVYIDIMRGIPILVFLMVLFYVVFAQTALSASVIAIIAFAMNLAAYVCEMFRTGIESVDKGQTEAGRAMGFGKTKTFFLIVVPQAMKHILPVYKGEAISLIKNTSVVGYIAIQDLTKVSDIIRSRTFDAFYPLIVISIVYFILAWLLGKLLDLLYRKSLK